MTDPAAVAHSSGGGLVIRAAVLLATGVAWSVGSAVQLLLRPDYWDPVSPADYLAVFNYSLAWLLTAASVLILRGAVPGSAVARSLASVTALGCALAGVANALEDGFGVSSLGSIYVLGVLAGALGLIALAVATWSSGRRRLALVPTIGAIAASTMTIGGGFVALIAWPGLAAVLVREQTRAKQPMLQTGVDR